MLGFRRVVASLLLSLVCSHFAGRVEAQNFHWAVSAGGPGLESGRSIAVDSAGNCYLAGSFQETAKFGDVTLTSAGGHDVFVAKYGPNGKLIWVRQGTGSFNGFGRAIRVDPNTGDVYLGGQFSGSLQFGELAVTSNGALDIFVVRVDAEGGFQWLKQFGGIRDDLLNGIAMDATGDCYLAGQFAASCTFGTVTLTSAGSSDAFLTKLSAAGNVLWAERVGGPEADSAMSVAVGPEGHLHVTGSFRSTAMFGEIAITAADGLDGFIAKYDSSGKALWATRAGGSLDDQVRSIAVDPGGNSYVTGHFQGSSDFGTIKLTDVGTDHLFVAKLNSEGSYQWVRSIELARGFGFGVAIDSGDGIFVVGQLEGRAIVGEATLAARGWDVYVGKLDAAGNFVWSSIAGGAGFDVGYAIAVGEEGDSYVTGVFVSEQAEFGCVTFSRRTADDDVFVARLSGSAVIKSGPQNRSVALGASAEFSVETSVTGATFQWRLNGVAIPGETMPRLRIPAVTLSHAGEYSVVVKYGECSVVSSAATLTIERPPSIVIEPIDQVVDLGSTIKLRVSAAGSAPLNYFWRFNETNLVFDTAGAELVLTNVNIANSGKYSVVVSNSYGLTTSRSAEVVVQPFGAPKVRISGVVAPRYEFTDFASVEVELESKLEGATIFYSLDGSPADASSMLYTGPFSVTKSVIINAISYDRNFVAARARAVSVRLVTMHAVTLAVGGGGTVTIEPEGGLYAEGSLVKATAIPAAGWDFIGWTGDAAGIATELEFEVVGPTNIRAIFGTEISVSATGRGSIELSPALPRYPYGSIVRVVAIPQSGSYFAIWGGDLAGNTNSVSITLTNASPQISALFLDLTTDRAALTVIAAGKGLVELEPRANAYAKDDTVTIHAIAEDGNKFLFWSGDAEGADNPLNVKMESSKVIRAHFTGGTSVLFDRAVRVGDSVEFSVFSDATAVLIETSTDLVKWSLFQVLTNQTGVLKVIDPEYPQVRSRFYRATLR